MICQPKQHTKIYVVDPQPNDYSDVVDAATCDPVRFTFFGSGRDALRHNPDDSPEIWVVNMDLPDMSGTDLYSMLRTRGSTVPVMLIGDNYSVEDEINARTSGATLYFAKPLLGEWLMAAGQHAA